MKSEKCRGSTDLTLGTSLILGKPYSFIHYLLRTYYIPEAALGAEESLVSIPVNIFALTFA